MVFVRASRRFVIKVLDQSCPVVLFNEIEELLRQVVLIVAGVSSPAAICSLCLREKMCGGGGAGAGAGGAQRRREGSGMLLPPDSSMSPSVATSAGSIQSVGSAAR